MSPVPPPRSSSPSGNVLVLAIAGMFVVVVASITFMVIAVEDGARVESMIGLMLAALTPTIATLVTLAQVRNMGQQVDFLANGGTDAKVRAAVADVIDPAVLRDDVHDQLAVDRAVRDRQVATHPNVPPAQ